MTEAQNSTPDNNPVVNTISLEDAQYLQDHAEDDPHSLELAHGLYDGLVDAKGPYALVVDKDDEGKEEPLHYITLGADLGTRIRSDNYEALGLPQPQEAFVALRGIHAAAEATKPQPSKGWDEAYKAAEATAAAAKAADEELPEDVVAAARQRYNQLTSGDEADLDMYLIQGDRQLERLVEAMDSEQKKQFDLWQIESAAVRAPKLHEVLAKVEKDSAGMYRPDAEQSKHVAEALSVWGISPEQERDVAADVTHARQLVANGQSRPLLHSLQFVSDTIMTHLQSGARRTLITLKDTAVEIPARQLAGAANFKSWMGRGYGGQDPVADRTVRGGGNARNVASIDQIENYATMETELPYLEEITMVITDKGPIFYSQNAHRAGAAQLRNSRVRSRSVYIYDARGMNKSESDIDEALSAVQHNQKVQ